MRRGSVFDRFYSDEAFNLMDWAYGLNDRLKAARITRAAQSLEQRFRDHHPEQVNNKYRFPRSMTLIEIMHLPPPPKAPKQMR